MKSKNDLEWMSEPIPSFSAVCRHLDYHDCQMSSEVEESPSPIDPKRPLSKRRTLNANSLWNTRLNLSRDKALKAELHKDHLRFLHLHPLTLSDSFFLLHQSA